jgi:hypothetical protein
MYFDVHRYRWLPAVLIVVPVLIIAGVAVFFLTSSKSPSTTTSSAPSGVTTSLPGGTTLPGGTGTTSPKGSATTLPSLPPASMNLASRKASVLAGEANSMSPSPSQLGTKFLKLANTGPAPHYTILTPEGGYAKYPGVMRLSVVGSSQIICLELPTNTRVPLPIPVVACP